RDIHLSLVNTSCLPWNKRVFVSCGEGVWGFNPPTRNLVEVYHNCLLGRSFAAVGDACTGTASCAGVLPSWSWNEVGGIDFLMTSIFACVGEVGAERTAGGGNDMHS
ncbi:unnamed protein product, partial [Ectocarpus fasciculatus]